MKTALVLAFLLAAPLALAAQPAPTSMPGLTPSHIIVSLSAAQGIDALPLPTIAPGTLREEILQLYLLGGAIPTARGIAALDARLADVPAEIQAPVAAILAAQNEAALLRARAFSGLTAEDAAALEALADEAAVATALAKVDLAQMHLAGRLVAAAIAGNLDALRTNAAALPAAFADPLNVVEIATVANDVHDVDRTLLVDLGGDDDWSNNAGATKPDYFIDAFPGCISTGALDCTALNGRRNSDSTRDLFGRSCTAYFDHALFESLRGPDVAQDFAEGEIAQPSIPDARDFATSDAPGFANGVGASLGTDDGCLPQDANDTQPWLDVFVTRGTLAQGDEHSVAVGVDVSGNDRFAPPLEFNDINDGDNAAGCDTRSLGDAGRTWARNLTAGSAFAGVGILWDGSGSDFYGGRSIAQGSGHVAGVGILVDDGPGNNVFSGVRLSQGVGFFAGLGLLYSGGDGDDRYALENDGAFFNEFEHFIGCDVSTRDGQGRGNFNGIGALVDLGGDDEYFVQQHDLSIPGAVRDDPRTTQGSAGSRLQIVGPPADRVFAGAIGLLYDARGNDTYTRPTRGNDITTAQADGIFVDNSAGGVASTAQKNVSDATQAAADTIGSLAEGNLAWGALNTTNDALCAAPDFANFANLTLTGCYALNGDTGHVGSLLNPQCARTEPKNANGLQHWLAWYAIRSVDDRSTYPTQTGPLGALHPAAAKNVSLPIPNAGPKLCASPRDQLGLNKTAEQNDVLHSP